MTKTLGHSTIGPSANSDSVLKRGQHDLLADPACIKGVEVGVRYQAMLEAGGDFYDLLPLGESQSGFLVADVAGHDLGVAYLTGSLKALSVTFTSELLSVSETVILLSAALRKFLREEQYATLCYAKYDSSSATVELISAAHPPALYLPENGPARYLELNGDVLGMFESVQCDAITLGVFPSDRLFLYTDGLIEGYGSVEGEKISRQVGYERLLRAVEALRGENVQKAVDQIVDESLNRMPDHLDDIVLMGIQF